MAGVPKFERLMAALFDRTASFMGEELDASVQKAVETRKDAANPELRDTTAIVGLGGHFNVLVVLSFDKAFADSMYARMSEGLDIAPDEEDIYRRDAAADLVNEIVGNCAAVFTNIDEVIDLSPPIILEGGRNVRIPKNAEYRGMCIKTDIGYIDIGFFGPREFF
jgi:CheY-specific phosphatase CheX